MYFKNIWLALLCVLRSKTFLDLLLNIDRVGNSFCAGHYKLTVSGRVGYFAYAKENLYWNILQWTINNTFHPIDGPNHCWNAFKWESSTDYRRGNDVALALLSIIVFVACLILLPIISLISLFNKR